MTTVAVAQEVITVLAGLGFVCLVLAVFVLVARFLARRLLGSDDGSSIDGDT